MSQFLIYMLYAIGGHAWHMLKKYGEAVKRNEAFITKPFLISEAMNLIGIPLMILLSDELPPEWFVMSNVSALLIGVFGSSMISGLVDMKRPKGVTEN